MKPMVLLLARVAPRLVAVLLLLPCWLVHRPVSAAPAPPTGVSATDGVFDNLVLVSWNEVLGAAGYEVWRSATSDFSSATRIAEVSWFSSYMDSAAPPGVLLHYWVIASDGSSRSNPSAPETGYAGNLAGETFSVAITALHGRVQRAPDQTEYTPGTQVILTAVPDVGYAFAGWSGDASGNANPLILTLTSDLSLTASFTATSTQGGTLTVILEPPEVRALGAQWKLSSETSWHASGLSLTALPFATYTVEFLSVSGWLAPAPAQIPLAANLPNVTWTFTYEPTTSPNYTLQVLAEHGTVSLEPSASSYAPGTTVRLTAQPDPGYLFSGWTGDAAGQANPLTLTITGHLSVTANFAPSVSPEVTVTHASEGYHSPGELLVTASFGYPANRHLLSLGWRPVLPTGWSATSATGDGNPEIHFGDIAFTGTLSNNPVEFVLRVSVPANQTGRKDIRGTVEYQLDGMVNPAQVSALPDPLPVSPSVDEPPLLGIANYVGLTLEGAVGATYEIQFTTQLEEPRVWHTLTNLTLTRPSQLWFDLDSVQHQARRFYRCVLAP